MGYCTMQKWCKERNIGAFTISSTSDTVYSVILTRVMYFFITQIVSENDIQYRIFYHCNLVLLTGNLKCFILTHPMAWKFIFHSALYGRNQGQHHSQFYSSIFASHFQWMLIEFHRHHSGMVRNNIIIIGNVLDQWVLLAVFSAYPFQFLFFVYRSELIYIPPFTLTSISSTTWKNYHIK